MTEQQFTQGHALIIGVGSDLPNTVQDATGLARILTDEERCAYPPSQVTVLTETTATRQHVLDKLDELATTVGPEDTLLFYFSGHGYQVYIETVDMNKYYLMPYGYEQADLPNTTISRLELMEKLNAINAKKQLILFDCCHASGLDDLEAETKLVGLTMTKSPLSETEIDELAKGGGRVIISSCKAKELSYAGRPYSKFTQALLEGFAGDGASRQDGLVLAADLATYAAKTVPLHTRNRQNPALNFTNADNFAVAYYAAGDSAPKGLPQDMQRQPDPELDNMPTGALTVNQSGSGNTQIVGNNNVVAGERAVAVGGSVDGNIVTGDNARVIHAQEYNEGTQHNVFNQEGQTVQGNQQNVAGNVEQIGHRHEENINTDGGSYVRGNVTTTEFVGRDKTVKGDEVKGDKVMGDKVAGNKVGGDSYSVGNISGSQGVAIGRNAQSNVNVQNGGADDILAALQPILLAAQNAPDDKRAEAVENANALKTEISKGNAADDGIVAEIVGKLGDLLPNAVTAIGTAFGQPVLAALAGPVTKHFLKKLGVDLS